MPLTDTVRVVAINDGPREYATDPQAGKPVALPRVASVTLQIASSGQTFAVHMDADRVTDYPYGSMWTMTLEPMTKPATS